MVIYPRFFCVRSFYLPGVFFPSPFEVSVFWVAHPFDPVWPSTIRHSPSMWFQRNLLLLRPSMTDRLGFLPFPCFPSGIRVIASPVRALHTGFPRHPLEQHTVCVPSLCPYARLELHLHAQTWVFAKAGVPATFFRGFSFLPLPFRTRNAPVLFFLPLPFNVATLSAPPAAWREYFRFARPVLERFVDRLSPPPPRFVSSSFFPSCFLVCFRERLPLEDYSRIGIPTPSGGLFFFFFFSFFGFIDPVPFFLSTWVILIRSGDWPISAVLEKEGFAVVDASLRSFFA